MAENFYRPVARRISLGWNRVKCGFLGGGGEKGPRSTTDSGMGSMENRYGLVPPQPGRRKRHADDGTLGGRYTDIKRNVDNVQWDDSQKRILFESEDLESTSSGSDSQEVRPGWPPDDMCADSTRCRQSFSEQERQGLQLLSPAVRRQGTQITKGFGGGKSGITLFTGQTG